MSPRTGRPKKDNAKRKRLEIRLTDEQDALLEECSEELKATKTDVIIKGIEMVKQKIDKNKE